MDWSILIGFGGLFIAGMSIYLSYKSQTISYRNKIYEKQIEIYSELFYSFDSLYSLMQDYIVQNGLKLNDKTRFEMREFIVKSKEYENFCTFYKKWGIFIPLKIRENLNSHSKLFFGITAFPAVAKQYPKEVVYSDDPGLLLSKAHNKVFESIRECLGIEPLSKETLNLFRRKIK